MNNTSFMDRSTKTWINVMNVMSCNNCYIREICQTPTLPRPSSSRPNCSPSSRKSLPPLQASFISSYDDNVTFHIIFQGQYLPAGFSWNTIANYYEEMGSQRVRQLEDSTEQTATNEPSTIQDVEDDSDDLERRANRPTSETKRRRIANDDSEWVDSTQDVDNVQK